MSIAKGLTAAPQSGTVVEYKDTLDFPNSPGGHFFYSSDPGEQGYVDSGAAGRIRPHRPHVQDRRPVAGLPVLRFGGPRAELALLHRRSGRVRRPESRAGHAHVRTRGSNGTTKASGFATTRRHGRERHEVLPRRHAGRSYRAYNNAYPPGGGKNPWDSNHRYSLLQSDITAMVAIGWQDEGIVFCAPQ
jgi:hypothetical protein